MNEPTSHLGRLFEEAIAHYDALPDVPRFERLLVERHRRRAGLVIWSAAACLALIGGSAFAFNQQDTEDHRLAPAHSQVDGEADTTAVKTTEHRPDKTVPDGGRDPIDKTTVAEPATTEPHEEPATTEKQGTDHTTAPKNTEPKSTEPGDGETTTTDGTPWEWSVHQVYFTSDAEPPQEVFWGTANPGDKITIESEYGYTKVFADDGNGEWEAHITFEGAPVGVAFQVWVHAPYHDEVFSFTYLG
ncbi:MAG: hypothetical protein HY826_01635 [Actinobacteria bacterium]|nr:hypothetical protein [Actinomycetota bacterium]